MKIRNLFKHITLVIRHKHKVFIHCVKCGLIFRGIVHDLSKFSPTELFESAKYFQGNRSPIGVCRRATGVSYAWLHHKGRNKHHIEYWYDPECSIMPMMPYKYAVECVCDKLAATYVYAGGKYENHLPLLHWNKHGKRVTGNPRTMEFIEAVFIDVEARGEDYVLNKAYMKNKFREVCEK